MGPKRALTRSNTAGRAEALYQVHTCAATPASSVSLLKGCPKLFAYMNEPRVGIRTAYHHPCIETDSYTCHTWVLAITNTALLRIR